jgi:selenocysteine lyase/cysteine desulfurase
MAGATAAVDYVASVGSRFCPAPQPSPASSSQRRQHVVAGMQAILDYESELCMHLISGLRGIPGLTIYGITESARLQERVPTVSFTLDGLAPSEIARRLAEANIFAWDGNFYALAVTKRLGLEENGGLLRVGLAHYNTEQEVDVLLGVLGDMPR